MFGSRHNISELSSAFSTGNSGATFEHNIQAVFLLTLLVDGFSPILEAPIDRIKLQAKHLGYAIDDFVVVAANGAKLLCQVKHTLAISYGDKQFEKVMNAAWHDFNSESYRPSFDKIALITGPIAKNSSHDLHCVYEQAWAAETAEEFRERIDREQFVSRSTQNMLETLRKCLRRANADQEIQDDQLWEICKCFVLVAFDVDYVHSINRVLLQSLIHCKSDKDAKLVWGAISRVLRKPEFQSFYSRFSETLRGVAEEYRAEAKEHAKQHDSFEE